MIYTIVMHRKRNSTGVHVWRGATRILSIEWIAHLRLGVVTAFPILHPIICYSEQEVLRAVEAEVGNGL